MNTTRESKFSSKSILKPDRSETLSGYLNFTTIRLLFLLFLANPGNYSAQELNLRFAHFTKNEGLSQNIVNNIFQDSRQFIWIGTNEGLNKFDGYDFTIFEKGPAGSSKLSDDVIQTIYEDKDNNLWVGTGSGGINILDRNTNKFTHLDLDSSISPYKDIKNIKSILRDKNDNIWFIAGCAIVKMGQDKKIINSYIPPHFKKANSAYEYLTTLVLDRDNNLWFGTLDNGLGFFDARTEKFKYYTHSPENNNSISDNDVRAIYEDNKGDLWIGTFNGGINLFNRDEKKFTKYLPDPLIRESYSIKCIAEDETNNLYVGTRYGIYIFNKSKKNFINFSHDPYNLYSLNQNNVQTIFIDINRNVWIGTKYGINLLKKESMPFTYYRTDAQDSECLNSAFVTSILEDSKGKIWFGTSDAGVNVLNRETGIFNYYAHNPNDPNSISSNSITCMEEDYRGNIWMSTSVGELNAFIYNERRFVKYDPFSDIGGLRRLPINSILFTAKDQLWIAKDNDISVFNINSKRYKTLFLFKDIPGTIITGLFKGTNNDIWVGTGNSKIYRVNKTTLEKHELQLPTTSKVTRINKIRADGDNLWIGTSGGGLFFFNSSKNEFSVYKKEDGLSNNYVTGLLKDDKGIIWISTLDGLSKFDPLSKTFINLYRENGLQNNQFSFGSLKSRSGDFFFGDIDGAISFRPENIVTTTYTAPVVLTDFQIFNKTVSIGGKDACLQKHISEADIIKLDYSQSSFTFAFAALDYTLSDKIEYAYMMDDFENNWNYVKNRRYATYTNLPPGNYTFKVKAANNAERWSDKIASIKVVIAPPYWETWWFRGLLAALAALLIWHFSLYLIQKRNLLKATALANLTQLKLLRNQMNPHFLLNTFSILRALILIDKDKAWEMVSKLSEFFRYMLLNYSREKDTLHEEIEASQNYISIQKECFHETLDVEFEIDDNARELTVPAFIFQPLIENAIKYGSQTSPEEFKIIVRIIFKDDVLTIDVGNTGNIFTHDDNNPENENIHGTSIKNIMNRLEIMFKDRYNFKLYESNGWVHAVIRIEYLQQDGESVPLHYMVGSDL